MRYQAALRPVIHSKNMAARRLGVDFRVDGFPTMVATASGVATAYSVQLDTVKIGDILLRNVAAVVIDGPQPSDVLLGMSFLNQVQIQNEGTIMTLTKKY